MTFQAQEMTRRESSHPSLATSSSHYDDHEGCECCLIPTNDQQARSYSLATCNDHDDPTNLLSMELVPTYRARAEACLQQGDFQQARFFLTKVIAILEQSQRQQMSFELGKVYLKIAEVACYQEDFDVVIDCCEKTQAIYEGLFPGNVDQMAFLYHAFGDLTALSGTDHAQQWFEKIRNLPTADTWNSPIMADVYARLANYSCNDNCNKEQGQQYYEKAWEILSHLEAEHDDNYGMTSSAYNNIGKYLQQQQQGDMPRALSCFEKCLQLHEDSNPGSASSAEDCFNIGLVLYQQQGDYKKHNLNEVIGWFQKALNMIASHQDETRPLFQTRLAMIEAVCHFSMGQALHDQGDYQQSLAHYQEALVIFNGLGSHKVKAFRGVDPRPIPTRAAIAERIQWNPFRLLSLSHDVVPAVWCRLLSSSKFQNDPQAMYYLMREHPSCSSSAP